MSVQVVPPSVLISMTPPSKNVVPVNSKPKRCVKVKLNGSVPTCKSGETSDWSDVRPGSGPSQRWSMAVISLRVQRAAVVPVVLQGEDGLSTSSESRLVRKHVIVTAHRERLGGWRPQSQTGIIQLNVKVQNLNPRGSSKMHGKLAGCGIERVRWHEVKNVPTGEAHIWGGRGNCCCGGIQQACAGIFDSDGQDPGFTIVKNTVTIATVKSVRQRGTDVFNVITADKALHQSWRVCGREAVRGHGANSRSAFCERFLQRVQSPPDHLRMPLPAPRRALQGTWENWALAYRRHNVALHPLLSLRERQAWSRPKRISQ